MIRHVLQPPLFQWFWHLHLPGIVWVSQAPPCHWVTWLDRGFLVGCLVRWLVSWWDWFEQFIGLFVIIDRISVLCILYRCILINKRKSETKHGFSAGCPFPNKPMTFVRRKFPKWQEIIRNFSKIMKSFDIYCVYSIIKVQ